MLASKVLSLFSLTLYCVQMLLDVVSVYNKASDLIDRKQSVKISIGGAQVSLLPE
jgi:hypothetical protein